MKLTHIERGNQIKSFLMQGWVELYKCLRSEVALDMKYLMPYFHQSFEEVINKSANTSLSWIDNSRQQRGQPVSQNLGNAFVYGTAANNQPEICPVARIINFGNKSNDG